MYNIMKNKTTGRPKKYLTESKRKYWKNQKSMNSIKGISLAYRYLHCKTKKYQNKI